MDLRNINSTLVFNNKQSHIRFQLSDFKEGPNRQLRMRKLQKTTPGMGMWCNGYDSLGLLTSPVNKAPGFMTGVASDSSFLLTFTPRGNGGRPKYMDLLTSA